MKKLLSMIVLLLMALVLYAEHDVTTFMGIPVDGTKEEMISKLRYKGFTPIEYGSDILQGEFNGREVLLFFSVNKNKVWRVAVRYLSTSSVSTVRTHFNSLCNQFTNNPKYTPMKDEGYEISEKEDISYEMIVHDKRYDAYFQQAADSVASLKDTEEAMQPYITRINEAESDSVLSNQLTEEAAAVLWDLVKRRLYAKTVWFTITRSSGDYEIILFYENGYNEAKGDDL